MDQKQKVVIFIIVIIAFLSIVMTETESWGAINLKNIRSASQILVPALKLLAVFLCVRLYRALHNPFFKYQGVALVFSMAVAELGELRLILVRNFYHFEEPFYQILGVFIGTISTIIWLAGILLALYALLRYREGWEQAEEAPFI